MCTVPLPPGVNPIKVDKYIEKSSRNYHTRRKEPGTAQFSRRNTLR